MTNETTTPDPMLILIDKLREEHRLKQGCDFAIARKYGRNRLVCADVFWDTIRDTAADCGVEFHTVALWKGNE